MEAGGLSPRLLVPFFFFETTHCFVVLAPKISLMCPENTFRGQREEEKVREEIETLTTRKEKMRNSQASHSEYGRKLDWRTQAAFSAKLDWQRLSLGIGQTENVSKTDQNNVTGHRRFKM